MATVRIQAVPSGAQATIAASGNAVRCRPFGDRGG